MRVVVRFIVACRMCMKPSLCHIDRYWDVVAICVKEKAVRIMIRSSKYGYNPALSAGVIVVGRA